MRSVDGDRKASAVIRDAATALFAERGMAVTVREIAAAAGVSPALVIHHFGSKEGLKAAVDAEAARVFEELLDELSGAADGPPLAAGLAAALDAQPALLGYLRRMLVDGGDTADALFRRLFAATADALGRLEAAGVLTPARDPTLRTAFLLANDLATVVLRDQLHAVLGVDPLGPDGLERWAAEVFDVYRRGVFAAGGAPR